MPNLTYWVAQIQNDSDHFNIRAKTKKTALAEIELHKVGGWHRFDAPKKVSVYYENAFDLAKMCLGEGSGFWE